MDIPQKIESIIAARKQQLPKVEMAVGRLQSAKAAVDRLGDLLSGYGSESETIQSMMQSNPELARKLESISTDSFYKAYRESSELLESLKKRFAREEVHISFVGRAGQGKSLVLQRISGLSGDIIPSAEGSDCTGARSIISNRPITDTRAEITFYSEKELVDIVNKYLEATFRTDAHNVSSVRGIAGLSRSIDSLKDIRLSARESAYLDHLVKYVDHVSELEPHLGQTITVPEVEIERYVAQYKSDDPNEKYYNYLGVKEANILSAFPFKQCGKIVLLDTIGTGATSLGVEDAMIETVKQDSDAIVLMMRPDAIRARVDSEDCSTIDKIANAVTEEYTRQMLFLVINRVETEKGNNVAKIGDIKRQIDNLKLPIAQYMDVNCWEQEEVESNLLFPVLEQLAKNLVDIDQMILDRANQQLERLESAYKTISSKIEGAMGASINQDERRQFDREIQQTIDRMTNEIRELYLKYSAARGNPSERLEADASLRLKNIVRNVPKKDEILQKLNIGRINQFNALEQLTNRIRINIIDDFLGLNPSLKEIVLDMKREVIHLLADKDKGRLGFIVGADLNDPDAWFRAILEKLNDPQYHTIYSAFLPLHDFELRMENFLIYKVRSSLDDIDWSLQDTPPQLSASLADKDALADEIRFWLEHLAEIIHKKVENALKGYYSFPNEAIFAVVRDFHDRIVYAGDQDIDTQWRYLYEDKIPMIWPEEHRAFMATAGMAEVWNDFTEQIHSCASEGYFLIK